MTVTLSVSTHVAAFIRQHTKAYGVPPTLRELARRFAVATRHGAPCRVKEGKLCRPAR